jgi:dual-specificity kinase
LKIIFFKYIGCGKWDEKSDIWSMACILVELYSGELFFPTHENVEHLALMEKVSGPFPKWMTEDIRDEFDHCFRHPQIESEVQQKGMRLDWPKCARKKESIQNFHEMKTLDVSLLL